MSELPDPQDVERLAVHHRIRGEGGVVHCATFGEGPALMLLHGFPDFWLTWWAQIPSLAASRRVIAIDLPGFNESIPAHQTTICAEGLIRTVAEVADHFGLRRFDVAGHDWGGYVAWQAAMAMPAAVRRLAVLSMPHPWALARELASNPRQQTASAYARELQRPESHSHVPLARLSAWVTNERYRECHALAMVRTDLKAALDYYRHCFPVVPYAELPHAPAPVQAPTLVLQGLNDPYALPEGHDGLWQWVQAPLRIEYWPDAGHFLQQEQPQRVAERLAQWFNDDTL